MGNSEEGAKNRGLLKEDGKIMGVNIIIKNRPFRFGKSRSEHEQNLRKDWGCRTLTDTQLDKCKWLEKKVGVRKSYFDQSQIDAVK